MSRPKLNNQASVGDGESFYIDLLTRSLGKARGKEHIISQTFLNLATTRLVLFTECPLDKSLLTFGKVFASVTLDKN